MSAYEILKAYDQTLMHIEDILQTSKGTNNIQLENLCRFLFGIRFLGVFSANEFPKRIKNNQCFIINNKPNNSKTGGEHWIAAYKYKNKIYMYDTFDRKIKDLSKYFKNKNIVNANSDRQQSYYEYNCGERCVTWLILFDKYKTKIINVI